MLKIGLLDPSLKDNNGTSSINIGDVIIYDAVIKVFNDVFGSYDLIRVSTHSFPNRKILKELYNCDLKIIGGTNLLSSDIKTYNQWKYKRNHIDKFFQMPIKDIVTLGVGWWQYQSKPTFKTKTYYKNLLSLSHLHSVRDSYTKNKMSDMGFNNVINTSCPTLWGLSGIKLDRKTTKNQDCVFTLTDYKPLIELDTMFLEKIMENFPGKIYYFAQGTKDIEYLNSLEIFQKNKSKFNFIISLSEYNEVLKTNIVFVGTRLHAGARALQNNVDTIVLEVDNRTAEIRKDTGFPSIDRHDFVSLQKWLDGEHIFEKLHINEENVNKWKMQFKSLQ